MFPELLVAHMKPGPLTGLLCPSYLFKKEKHSTAELRFMPRSARMSPHFCLKSSQRCNFFCVWHHPNWIMLNLFWGPHCPSCQLASPALETSSDQWDPSHTWPCPHHMFRVRSGQRNDLPSVELLKKRCWRPCKDQPPTFEPTNPRLPSLSFTIPDHWEKHILVEVRALAFHLAGAQYQVQFHNLPTVCAITIGIKQERR